MRRDVRARTEVWYSASAEGHNERLAVRLSHSIPIAQSANASALSGNAGAQADTGARYRPGRRKRKSGIDSRRRPPWSVGA